MLPQLARSWNLWVHQQMKELMKTGIMLFVLAAMSSTALLAQDVTTTKKASNTNPGGLYIRGGYSMANISTNGDGTVDKANMLSTFNAGFLGDLPINDMFSFQAGLFLQGKGSETTSNFGTNSYRKYTFRPYYLQVPVNFAVKIPVSDDSRIFIGAGPFVSMGLFGKTTVTTKLGSAVETTSKEDIKFESIDGNDPDDSRLDRLKRFEFGLNGLAGIEVGRLMLGVNYDWGFTKINQAFDNENNDKNKYRTFSINLGVRL
jgi:hypothetical protein